MNHPTSEQWMSYLYGELRADERAPLAAHLRNCPVCAAHVNGWQSAARDLDAWQIRARGTEPSVNQARRHFARPLVQWAAAALILLGAGLAFGRLGSAAEAKKLRAAIEPQIRQQLREEFEAKRMEDNRAFYRSEERREGKGC